MFPWIGPLRSAGVWTFILNCLCCTVCLASAPWPTTGWLSPPGGSSSLVEGGLLSPGSRASPGEFGSSRCEGLIRSVEEKRMLGLRECKVSETVTSTAALGRLITWASTWRPTVLESPWCSHGKFSSPLECLLPSWLVPASPSSACAAVCYLFYLQVLINTFCFWRLIKYNSIWLLHKQKKLHSNIPTFIVTTCGLYLFKIIYICFYLP